MTPTSNNSLAINDIVVIRGAPIPQYQGCNGLRGRIRKIVADYAHVQRVDGCRWPGAPSMLSGDMSLLRIEVAYLHPSQTDDKRPIWLGDVVMVSGAPLPRYAGCNGLRGKIIGPEDGVGRCDRFVCRLDGYDWPNHGGRALSISPAFLALDLGRDRREPNLSESDRALSIAEAAAGVGSQVAPMTTPAAPMTTAEDFDPYTSHRQKMAAQHRALMARRQYHVEAIARSEAVIEEIDADLGKGVEGASS